MTGRLGQPSLVQPPLLRFLGSRICLSRRPSNGLLRVSRLFPWLDGAMWPLVLLAGFRDSLVGSRLAPFQSHGGYHFLFGIDSDGSAVRESLALWKTRAKLSNDFSGVHFSDSIANNYNEWMKGEMEEDLARIEVIPPVQGLISPDRYSKYISIL